MQTRKKSTVYSTEHGRMCPKCNSPVDSCSCGRKKGVPKGDGIVRIGLETKCRKGKGVTTVAGVPFDPDDLKKLAKELKKKCGTGGTVKDGVIEIQGDHRDLLLEILSKRWPTRLSGG